MESSEDPIIQVKDEQLMVSPLSGENPVHRTAYFIKPCVEDSATLPHSMFSSGRTATVNSDHAKLLEVRYKGWHYPSAEWNTWVQQMQHKYECVWMKAGIDQAIKASTFQIRRNDELIIELAQRWCSKTNTFVFPWGEATITLEDMKVCWGYSVMGAPISSPLVSGEEREIEQKLIGVFRMFFKSKARRADHTPWMKHFMSNESRVEHEAFLSLWLSRFVFPGRSYTTILKSTFPIAIHLARGLKLALAPAVLASIYRDLSLLNNKIRIVATVELEVTLWAPFQLVQVWALERFPALQPLPDVIEQGQLLMTKWHAVKMLKGDNLKLILDSVGAENGFIWHPYENSPALQLYNENDMWVCDNPNFDDELESFARCLRVSELVGMECIEQYLPNRVAMQFGMDQDIPGMLAHYNDNPWIKSGGSYGPPPGFTSKINAKQEKDFDEEGKLSIIELSDSSNEVRCLGDEEVGNGKALSSPPSDVFPSASVEGARTVKDNGNEVKIEHSFCDRNDVNDKEGEDASHRIANIASNLESRIWKLERVIAKLKAAKFGHKVQNIGVKAEP
ncbi:uncharacterized protein LOC114396911 [Glycine soja]|uniref:uncharacterized protein LOC114396911 n=1 Tax=Glycine soja TaxID=3848 RepID=UPI00071907B7|nr:uncharacterized protein LOC114396911 [Glycine soja]